MEKRHIIIIALIIIIGISTFFLIDATLTGQTISNYYHTYTKAVCDDTNFCQDYEVVCEDDRIISVTPIPNASTQHSSDWEDPRINKSEITCE